jgi:hypothetical protein
MIGQENIQNKIRQQIENNTFPRFSILVGQKGSGRKTLAKEIGKWLGGHVIQLEDVKVESIRFMIDDSYKIAGKTLYIISDADSMSQAAKNAILKVTEEPPNNAYFLMTLEDENNTLATIRSRGTVFRMDRYTPEELERYSIDCGETDETISIIKEVCETPGDVNMLIQMDTTNFYDYVILVVDNIAEVGGANAFKIGDKIAFKNEEDKYDLRLFLKAFMSICAGRLHDEPVKYAHGVRVTSKYLQQLRINGISKQGLFDSWLLSIREEWME